MERVGAVGQADAVAAFLQAELESERFSPALRRALAAAGEDDALILGADLGDAAANARRHEILFAYRGGYLGRWFDDLVEPHRARPVRGAGDPLHRLGLLARDHRRHAAADCY
jgi:hypothetical protein